MTDAIGCPRCGGALADDARFCGRCGAPVGAGPRPAKAGAARDIRYAGIVRRWVAYALIDGLLAFLVAILGGVAVELALTPLAAEQLAEDDPLARGVVGVAVVGLYVAYYWWGNATGRSPGKRALGLRVVRAADRRPPGWRRGFVRTLGYALGTIPFSLGLLWALWDPERRAWHDKLAGTIVLADR